MKNLKKKYPSLQGKFLISSPNINDSIFKKALIYIISDNENGTMGIIINKPALKINISSILGGNVKKIGKQPKVFYGGPVELDRGFVLHTDGTFSHDGLVSMTGRGANHSGTGNSHGYTAPVAIPVKSGITIPAAGGAGGARKAQTSAGSSQKNDGTCWSN